MDIVIFVICGLLLLLGIAGCIIPGIPGWPFSWLGLFALHFTAKANYVSTKLLAITLIIGIIIQVLDYLAPLWFTKKFGGSKYGIWGSIIGLFVGLIFPIPYGFIIGPFLGAILGEFLTGKKTSEALKSGFGNFLGFICTTIAKIVYALTTLWLFIKAILGM